MLLSAFVPSSLKYIEVARINFRARAAYPLSLLGRLVTIGLRVWIFYAVYSATYRGIGASQIGGITLAQLLWILALTQSFQSSTRPPSISTIMEEEIRSGEFAYTVSRPYSFILFHVFSHWGRVLPMLIVNLIGTSVIAYFLVGPVEISALALLCGGLCLMLGVLLDFLMTFIIGLCALWIEETQGLFVLFQKMQLLLGGQVLPLTMFPPALRSVAETLPFAHLYYSAAFLLVSYDFHTFLRSLCIQLTWISIFGLLAAYFFRRGMQSVSINGG